jgi:hypothetical protein
MILSHQGQRERLLTYVCTIPYSVLRCCKVLVGFRVRVGYLCGMCGVHEDRYEYVVINIHNICGVATGPVR